MAEQKREKPLHELLSRTMVDIYVGPDNAHYILHEKLLCYRSPFFAKIFYNGNKKESQTKDLGLPDEDEGPFNLFVGWLYSGILPTPQHESDMGPLLEVYLMAEKWGIESLRDEVVETVRTYYHLSGSYPGLRRVQYIYAETDADSPMRTLLVDSVARYLALGSEIPQHWSKALQKNGQLALDIIRAIQQWHLESNRIPDARDGSLDRGRVKQEEEEEPQTNGVNGHAE